MKIKVNVGAIFVLLLSAGCAGTMTSIPVAKSVYQAHTHVDLVSPQKSVKPGEALWVGLRMKMDDEWHVYWKNPGDSGLQPTIKWNLPEGFFAGEIQWPYPHRINVPPLTTYGYENQVILFALIQTPQKIDGDVVIKARVDWLACKIECIPGRADLELKLPVTATTPQFDPALKKVFEDTQKKWSISVAKVETQAYEQNGEVFFEIGPQPVIKENSQISFFPDRSDVINHAATQVLKKDDNNYTLSIEKSALQTKPLNSLSGILVNESGWEGVDYPQAMLVNSSVQQIVSNAVKMPTANSVAPNGSTMTLIAACVFAVIGGLILNLMPCVLPVLSLKILHLVEHSRNRKKAFTSGLVFAAGIIVSFWILAFILISLRSLGSAIGWGFQFQSPVFVVAIAMILFIFALNLFGVFEIGTGLTTLGNAAAGKKGYTESFLSGVLATIVATPCTAPFMGTALSFALSRSAFEAFAVFTCLGVGMAIPVVILSRFPKLLKSIPKPGPWMNTMKVILGFILLASVIWLVWVFGLQKGIAALTALLASFLCLSVGLYFYGRAQIPVKKSFLVIYNAGLFILVGFMVAWYAVQQPVVVKASAPSAMVDSANKFVWQNYSQTLFHDLIQSKRPFFLDFTAAWCLSCQVNDRVALSDQRVIDAFLEHKIIPVKADWTNNDPEITAALAAYGRNSIPLYVFYPGDGAPPVMLPEIITPGIVLDFLQTHIQKESL